MARQKLGSKKVKKLRETTGLDIIKVLVRGNTDHRKDLHLADGSTLYLYKDGSLEKPKIDFTEIKKSAHEKET